MSAHVLYLRDRPANLTADEARKLTDRIRARVAQLLPLIRQAFERRADVALGYPSWTDYCDNELRGLRLPLSDRRAAVTELRQHGMSTRAIAAAVGASPATISRDLAGVSSETPARVTGLDGQSYAASRPSSTPDTPGVPAGRDHDPNPGVPSVATTDRPGETHSDPPAGVGEQYERDPARRTAAVAEAAPEYVRPAPQAPHEGDVGGGGVKRAADTAAPRPVHITLTQREADLLTTYAADILDCYQGEDRDVLLSAITKVGDALIAVRQPSDVA